MRWSLHVFPIFLAAIAVAAPAFAGWEYETKKDVMTGKTDSIATLRSQTSLHLTFPYQGENFGTLIVRKHPRLGTDVIYTVQKGQILCSTYRGCDVLVRFDDRPPITFGGNESSDYDRKIVFLKNPTRFITEASKAKTIRVAVTLHDNGQQALQFDSAKPLEWKSGK